VGRLRRSALRRWLVVVGFATLAALLVGGSVTRAEATRRRWGTTTTVVVLARPVAAGTAVGPATVVREWPVALVPDGSLRTRSALPADAVAVADLAAGGPVTPGMVAAPARERRPEVALPTGEVAPPVEAGDEVTVWATTDPSLGSGRATTRAVAVGARVVEVGDRRVVVAVTADEETAVVEAVALATVTITKAPR
jgi:hypothetical protein